MDRLRTYCLASSWGGVLPYLGSDMVCTGSQTMAWNQDHPVNRASECVMSKTTHVKLGGLFLAQMHLPLLNPEWARSDEIDAQQICGYGAGLRNESIRLDADNNFHSRNKTSRHEGVTLARGARGIGTSLIHLPVGQAEAWSDGVKVRNIKYRWAHLVPWLRRPVPPRTEDKLNQA